jgi:AcrR family transcriptional regulator
MTATLLAVANTRQYPQPGDSFSSTEVRILSRALAVIGRRGVRRLGMQEIAEAAGVSRGTLYRYFPNKSRVLAAAAECDAQRFSAGLHDVLITAEGPEEQVASFMTYCFSFIRAHPCRPLFESEPGFVMGYLLDYLPQLRAEIIGRLGDALDSVPAVAEGALRREHLADLIVRLFAANWIIPETDDDSLVQSLNQILQLTRSN